MSAAHLFVELGVHAFYGLVRRLRRRALRREGLRWDRADPLEGGRDLRALSRDYFGYDLIALALFFLLGGPLVFFWLDLFRAAGLWFAPDTGADWRLLRPSVWAWALPALFAALASVAPLLGLLMKRVLAERYWEYAFYAKKAAGFDVVKTVKAMTAVMAVFALGAAVLFSSALTAFLDDRIVVKGLLAEARGFAYEEIVAIRAVRSPPRRNETPADRRPGHYEILFRDGTLWRSTDGLRDSLPRCDYRALAWAAWRSGRRISGPDIRLDDRTPCR